MIVSMVHTDMWRGENYGFVADESFGSSHDYSDYYHTCTGNQPSAEKDVFDLVGNCVAEAYGAIFNPVSAECLFISGAK